MLNGSLIIVAAVLLMVYLMYGKRKSDKADQYSDADQYDQYDQYVRETDGESDDDSVAESVAESEAETTEVRPRSTHSAPTSRKESGYLCNKFKNRNKATRESGYKSAGYDTGVRGDMGPSGWDKFFDQNNDIIQNSQTGASTDFVPVDESGGHLAVFKSKGGPVCGSNQGCQPEDLFDVDKYLPQEVNDDWFEVQAEPVSVKNRHLINITKPIGVNTIGTSMKNSSYDIRGSPACNKVQGLSPWLNSNITADSNLKPLM